MNIPKFRYGSRKYNIICMLGENGETKKENLMIAAYDWQTVNVWKSTRMGSPFIHGDGLLGLINAGLVQRSKHGHYVLTANGLQCYKLLKTC